MVFAIHQHELASNGTSLQYSCLENPMDGGAWQAAVHGVTKGWTQLSNFTLIFHFHALEKEMATYSSVLAWRIPGTGEPGGLQSMGSKRVGDDWATSLSLFTSMHWRRPWQPTPVFLPGESHGRRSLVGYSPWGHKELDMTEQLTHLFAALHSILWACVESCFSFTKLCLVLYDPTDCSMPGFPVLHHLPEFAQTLAHWLSDAIQPISSIDFS